MVVPLFSSGVFHTDLHEFLKGGVISIVPVSELVHKGLGFLGYIRHACYIINQ